LRDLRIFCLQDKKNSGITGGSTVKAKL
jgi:hypothetical protein